jgi:hypothetical protein
LVTLCRPDRRILLGVISCFTQRLTSLIAFLIHLASIKTFKYTMICPFPFQFHYSRSYQQNPFPITSSSCYVANIEIPTSIIQAATTSFLFFPPSSSLASASLIASISSFRGHSLPPPHYHPPVPQQTPRLLSLPLPFQQFNQNTQSPPSLQTTPADLLPL